MKKGTIKTLKITIFVFLASGFLIWLILWLVLEKEGDLILFDPDNEVVFIIDVNDFTSTTTYEPKEHLKDLCWVRALTKLAQIYEDPNIITASMTAGWCTHGWGGLNAHAWIEYSIRDSNDFIRVIRYDPRDDVYLEPLPEDANLLIPVIPKEPREALKIIEQHSPD